MRNTTEGPIAQILPVAPSRRSAAIWSLFFSYGLNILILVRTVVLVPLYLHYIGVKEYGSWLATGGIISFLTVMDLGLMGALTQQAAVAYGAGERSRLERVIGTGMVISLVLSLMASLVAGAICPFVPRFMGLTGKIAWRLAVCFLIVALSNGLNLFGYAAGGVLRSFQRTFLIGFFLILSEGANILVTVILLLKEWGLYSIALGLAVRSIIMVAGNVLWCLWVCYRELKIRPTWTWSDTKALWQMSAYVFASRVASSLLSMSDAFIVGVLIGPEIAAVYSFTTRAHQMVCSLAGQFSNAIMPSLAHLHGERNLSRLREVIVVALKIQATVAGVGIAGVMAFNKSFVNLWVGGRFFAGNFLNVVIAVWGVGYIVWGVVWQVLYAMGEIPSLCKIVWLETIIKIILAVTLILSIGLAGVAAASLIAQIAAPICMLTILLIRLLNFTASEYSKIGISLLKRVSIPIFLALAVAWLGGSSQGWLSFSAKVGTYMALALTVAVFMDRGLFRFLRQPAVRTISESNSV